jgi:hypothetical protein
MTPSDHEVIIDWLPREGEVEWNNPLAKVLQVFGLPGHRFISTPTEDFMTVTFKNKKDADLCRILLSERL